MERSNSTKEEIIKDILKYRMIFEIIKGIKVDANHEDAEQIQKIISYVHIAEYVHMGGGTNGVHSLLGLNDVLDEPISYTAKKYIRDHVIKTLTERAEAKKPTRTCNNNNAVMSEILEKQQKIQQNYEEISKLQAKNYALLKKLAEMKLSASHVKKLQILHSETNLNQIKATLLGSVMKQHYATRSEHAVQAIKEVMEHMKQQLEKK